MPANFILQFDCMESRAIQLPATHAIQSELICDPYPFPFRLYDGDDNLCFCGRSSEAESFEPLDYAKGAHGCTRIDYKNEYEEWETL